MLRNCDNVQNYVSLAELAEASRTVHDIGLCSLPTYFFIYFFVVVDGSLLTGIKMSIV